MIFWWLILILMYLLYDNPSGVIVNDGTVIPVIYSI